MSRKAEARVQRCTGRVTAVHGRHFRVELTDGNLSDCVTRGKKGGIACGDFVEFSPTGLDSGVIERILERRNLLYRSDMYRSKLLAANVDHVFIVTAATPSPDIQLLNRSLIACEAAGIPVHILVNKSDLAETRALLNRLMPYEKLGYPIMAISAQTDTAPLIPFIGEGTCIFIGASGVGKSTLVNGLVPTAQITTQEISEALDAGRHTTTNTRLYHLPQGGALIDSPGMQEFGLKHIDPSALPDAFPEIRERIGQCRFYNCRHLKEPGCAVLEGLTDGAIQRERWEVYRQLVKELAQQHY